MSVTAAQARKAMVALLGVGAQVVDAGLVPEQYRPYGAVVVALATAAGVYQVPNQPKPLAGLVEGP